MKWRDWLANWGMSSLRISTPFLDMEFKPRDEDRKAAWELYIELLTRVATQPLAQEHGDEKTALDSIHALFPTSRETIKKYGPRSREFTKIAIVVLNQVVRPFTAKWHRLSLQGAFNEPIRRTEFRQELAGLQETLLRYTQMLGNMAGVEEDLTRIEELPDSPGPS
ncbi:MAG: hypothetical protein L0Y38_11085 [Methylococcaceae bacterium]|nr:hypothetical protein [Methylococcaceae bacterium]